MLILFFTFLGKNPCELQCWSKDRSIVYSFGKAIDGTKCATSDPRQPALCINGRCTVRTTKLRNFEEIIPLSLNKNMHKKY